MLLEAKQKSLETGSCWVQETEFKKEHPLLLSLSTHPVLMQVVANAQWEGWTGVKIRPWTNPAHPAYKFPCECFAGIGP